MESGQRTFHPGMNACATLVAPRSTVSLLVVLASLLLLAPPLSAQQPGTWAQLATNMNQARYGHTATLLPDGKELIVGGQDAAGQVLSTAEIYDPVSGLYTWVNSNLPTPVWGHAATLLKDGTVLISGGKGSLGQPVTDLQSFDPSAELFAHVGSLTTPRWRHTATPLSNGQILIAGGHDGSNALSSLELYLPRTQTVQNVGLALATPRENHTATRLGDGRVLIAGGSNGSNATASAELYDPDDSTLRTVGSLVTARMLMSAALLLDGSVLVAGGQDVSGQDLGTLEIYSPSHKTFTQLPVALTTPRSGHLGLALPYSGKVVFAGGNSAGVATTSTEIYDPLPGTIFPVAPSVDGRQQFGANVLEPPFDGMLFTTGGLDSLSIPLASSEALFFPTIRSDKLDYQPGDTIFLTGAGWLPDETVTITIHESSNDPDATLVVTADANGAISNSQLQINSADAGVRFTATARGQTSLWTAQTTFTDSVTLFSEAFGVSSDDNDLSSGSGISGWTDSDAAGSDCYVESSGGGYVRLRNVCSVARTINTAGRTNIRLQYTWGQQTDSDGSDDGDLVVEWKLNSAPTWSVLNTHDLANGVTSAADTNVVDVLLPASANNSLIDIRFRSTSADSGNDQARVDNVVVRGDCLLFCEDFNILIGDNDEDDDNIATSPGVSGWTDGDNSSSDCAVRRDDNNNAHLRLREGCIATKSNISTVGYTSIQLQYTWGHDTDDSNPGSLVVEWKRSADSAWSPVATHTLPGNSEALSTANSPAPFTFPVSANNTSIEIRFRGMTSDSDDRARVDNITITGTLAPAQTTPVITFGPAPTPTYLGGNFTVSASTTNTDSSTLTYSQVSGPCALVSGATFSSSGAGTCVVRASGAATTNFLAASADQNVTIAKAATSLLYNGAFVAVIGNNVTLTATLSSSVAACKTGQTIHFSLDDSPTTAPLDGPYSLGVATSNANGLATLTVPTTGWLDGVYTITVSYSGVPNANCANSSDDATLTAAAPGDSATGGGWYTPNGRLNFGFTVRRIPNVTPIAYRGQILIHNNGKWRFKGALNSYVLGTSGANAGVGTVGGTGNLYRWDATANSGLGDWVLVAQGIGLSASFKDIDQGGGKRTQDMFGAQINYNFPGNNNPNSSLTEMKGGNISIK